jgi:ssDNA-binding Zn-finger/Zn-ribbon topoisomerase 1
MTDPRPPRTDPPQVDLRYLRDRAKHIEHHHVDALTAFLLERCADELEQIRPLRAKLDKARAAYVKAAGDRYRVWEENEKLRAELDRVNDLYSSCLRGNDRLRAENESLRAALDRIATSQCIYTGQFSTLDGTLMAACPEPYRCMPCIARVALNPPGTAVDREATGPSVRPQPQGWERPLTTGVEHQSVPSDTGNESVGCQGCPDCDDRLALAYEYLHFEGPRCGTSPIRGETDPAPTCPNCRTPMVWDTGPGGSFWLCRQCNEADWWTSNPAAAPTQAATTGVGALEELIEMLRLECDEKWIAWIEMRITYLQALHDSLPRKLSPAADCGLLLLVRAMREGR